MQRIPVSTAGGDYDVLVEPGAVSRAGAAIAPLNPGPLFVVADPNAWQHHGEAFAQSLDGRPFTLLTLEPGESNKRLTQVERLSDELLAHGADRKACIVALGGGICGDVAGFLAASYMRGVDAIQIPTTLLAQVDSSVGGKTGVNLREGKNLVGAFHQPRLVIADPEVLRSLPPREYRAGLFEVLKHGVIRSLGLFELLEKRREDVLALDPDVVEQIVAESVRIKAAVVQQDEKEGNLRRILNYGHTLGHAVEAETNYARFLHGEAIAYGMVAAGRLAESLDILPTPERQRIEDLIRAYGPIPPLDGLSPAALTERTKGDKKTIAGHVHFVLAEEIGKVRVVRDPDPTLVAAAAESALDYQSEPAGVSA